MGSIRPFITDWQKGARHVVVEEVLNECTRYELAAFIITLNEICGDKAAKEFLEIVGLQTGEIE